MQGSWVEELVVGDGGGGSYVPLIYFFFLSGVSPFIKSNNRGDYVKESTSARSVRI